MARKRPNGLEERPAASTEEDEHSSSGEEEEDDDEGLSSGEEVEEDDEPLPAPTQKKPPPKAVSKAPAPDSARSVQVQPSDEDEDGGESDQKPLQVDFRRVQLADKIKRLRTKYANNSRKGKQGKEPHDQKLFAMSKEIWGNDGLVAGLESTGNQKSSISGLNRSFVDGISGVGALEKSIIRRATEVMDEAMKEELEKKWRELEIAEHELLLARRDLMGQHVKLLLEHYNYKSSDK